MNLVASMARLYVTLHQNHENHENVDSTHARVADFEQEPEYQNIQPLQTLTR